MKMNNPLGRILASGPMLVLALALALSACGSGSKPAPPHLSVSVQHAKSLHFEWNSASGAKYYQLYKNPDGSSGYQPVSGALGGNSYNHPIAVHREDWENASYLLAACNKNGCRASSPVYVEELMLSSIGLFHAANPAQNDFFGYSVAMSGDGWWLAVGATNRNVSVECPAGETCNPVANAGSVTVFSRQQDGSWKWHAELTVATGEAHSDAYLGYSLVLSEEGDTLVVGTPFESSNATGINGDRDDDSATRSGAAFVFVRDDDEWTEQAYLKASNSRAHGYFGVSIALSADGNRLAVGAYGEESNATGINGDQEDTSVGIAGAVYLFERENATWTQTTYVKPSTQAYFPNPGCFNPSPVRCLPTIGISFGYSVALSADGTTLAVGATTENSESSGINGAEDNINARRSGAAYVFVEEDGVWQQQAYIKASNSREHLEFGHRIALSASGNTLAVTSIMDNSAATGINGDETDTSMRGAGAAYVFVRDQGQWQQQAYIKPENPGEDYDFGSSVALSANGRLLAVGAKDEASGSKGVGGDSSDASVTGAGAVYLFRYHDGAWHPHRYIKAIQPVAHASFGRSLDLSNSGNSLAVGSLGESATSNSGSVVGNAGAALLF